MAKNGSGVQIPIFAFLTGSLLLISALRGISVVDVLAGVEGDKPLNPGGSGRSSDIQTPTAGGSPTSGPTSTGGDGTISTDGGAIRIVADAYRIAHRAGGSSVTVVSSLRSGSTTSSGNVSDHSANNSTRAARDIAKRGVDAIKGPPTPELDKAVVAIGKAFGRDYGNGKKRIVDTFTYKGYRVQIIWRTPEYGGHMGHIHVGAHKL